MTHQKTLVHVAENLRRLRVEAGLSQTALATASGVSRRMIVNLEKGDVNVSLNTLDRLGEALGVVLYAFIAPPDTADSAHIDEIAWTGAVADSRGRLLASKGVRTEVELWDWSLGPGDIYTAEADPDGWTNMVVVIAGSLTITVGETCTTIEAGDFHVFASNHPYQFTNTRDETVRFVRNVVY
ncbi:helix-turn-helix domain-containing protein [Salinisphaera sp. Q1T1-3]|uniref:helix-turn-helix domain-containing protein n=1 Tax=Salinisphaera sp. Q1T1-3 TaxID=2321229 RepID=UPI000E7694F9|nr:XRE family transcriptional regulator [Salinisphaera sp. Q1T1-3]RJS91620.1 XRE family transcriptional regulator [Salinisphaera sp. Q1T1-3]